MLLERRKASNTSMNYYVHWTIAWGGSDIAAMDYNKLNCYIMADWTLWQGHLPGTYHLPE
jgi:hypothetical protein